MRVGRGNRCPAFVWVARTRGAWAQGTGETVCLHDPDENAQENGKYAQGVEGNRASITYDVCDDGQ